MCVGSCINGGELVAELVGNTKARRFHFALLTELSYATVGHRCLATRRYQETRSR